MHKGDVTVDVPMAVFKLFSAVEEEAVPTPLSWQLSSMGQISVKLAAAYQANSMDWWEDLDFGQEIDLALYLAHTVRGMLEPPATLCGVG